ncbi:uncharacterized protein LAESUDRAFT_735884 [Laetiporus sulphureus 93-53]|uniref:Wax synthase domain-containing protein n=1 Tax=Laetiporus sulphureus 93-53 TaxID=1314785 RepID=A0A165FCJ5_9APHY|nr:uncharacterized protein LAESUDRAFT_735884 [Laetiporus sulphureus 93-53]KZT08763.1 hypothetical protein LAESUDRAFT_735884 [Laetiporus sulphureus 93-53]
MNAMLWSYPSSELHISAQQAFRVFVPLDEDRIPLTWRLIPHSLVYFVPFLWMAYLVRRAHTYTIRLFLLPIVISTTIYCTYRYKVPDPYYTTGDWGRTYMALVIIAKALDFGFVKDGRFKVGEERLPEVFESSKPPSSTPTSEDGSYSLIPQGIRDAFEVAFTMRGIGWDFGVGLYVPPDPRPQERGPFLKATASSLLWHYLIVDICNSLLKLTPGVGSPSGGSMFYTSLPIPLRYVVSTGIHIVCGTLLMCGMDAVNELLTLIFVALFSQSPAAWPPISHAPWCSTSLHELWGHRWHQALRYVFFVFGGYAGRWLAGGVGMVFGTFLASGLYHEIGMRMVDGRVTFWFLLQAVGTLIETMYTRRTGKRVDGVVGWLWMAFFIFGLGQICTNSWCMRGLMGGFIVPQHLSITRQVVFPLLKPILA